MTATKRYRIDRSNIDPIIDAWPAELPDSSHGIVGFYVRREYGEEPICNTVRPNDACRLYTDGDNLIRCSEDGSW